MSKSFAGFYMILFKAFYRLMSAMLVGGPSCLPLFLFFLLFFFLSGPAFSACPPLALAETSAAGAVRMISTNLAQRPIGPLTRALIGGAQPLSWLVGPHHAELCKGGVS